MVTRTADAARIRPGLARRLNELASRYGRAHLDTDPISFVHEARTGRGRELTGLLASSLAFGNVAQIRRSVAEAVRRVDLDRLASDGELGRGALRPLHGLRHRFVTGADLAEVLAGALEIRRRHGSLGARFVELFGSEGGDLRRALSRWATEIRRAGAPNRSSRKGARHLLPDPSKGSACKRLHMYLRWMVRRDDVDLGLWRGVPSSALLLPLDTHTSRISRYLGLTTRATVDWRMAEEVTGALRQVDPEDPVRFDFALSRLGILDRCPNRPVRTLCRRCSLVDVCVVGGRRGGVRGSR